MQPNDGVAKLGLLPDHNGLRAARLHLPQHVLGSQARQGGEGIEELIGPGGGQRNVQRPGCSSTQCGGVSRRSSRSSVISRRSTSPPSRGPK